MGSGRRPTPCPDPSKLRQLVTARASCADLMEHFGISLRAINRWLGEQGLAVNRPKGNIYTSRHGIWQRTNTQEKIDAMFPPERRERFWSYVARLDDDDCWLWRGSTSKHGYGHYTVRHRNHRAHRVSWLLTNGPIPADLHVLHDCDNPSCVNPSHLHLGTPKDNTIDRGARRRTQHGERHYCAKLTEADVRAIRASTERRGVLAKRYGINHTAIKRCQDRITWKHVP